jgi:hypothetical protein
VPAGVQATLQGRPWRGHLRFRACLRLISSVPRTATMLPSSRCNRPNANARLLRVAIRSFHLCLSAAAATFSTQLGAQAGPPSTDVWIVPLTPGGAAMPRVGAPLNVTHRDGYDNQPAFSSDGRFLLYTSTREDAQSDIYRYDFSTGLAAPFLKTRESEYSAFPSPNDDALSVIRVELDSTQRLWRMPASGTPSVMFPSVKPVGYFAQADDSTWALFVLGSPNTMQIAHTNREGTDTVARNIGRALHRIPGTKRVSYVQKGANGWFVMSYDPAAKRIDTLVATVSRTSEDIVWADSSTLLSASGSKLFAWKKGTTAWTEIADFKYASLDNITRLAVSLRAAVSGSRSPLYRSSELQFCPRALIPSTRWIRSGYRMASTCSLATRCRDVVRDRKEAPARRTGWPSSSSRWDWSQVVIVGRICSTSRLNSWHR